MKKILAMVIFYFSKSIKIRKLFKLNSTIFFKSIIADYIHKNNHLTGVNRF